MPEGKLNFLGLGRPGLFFRLARMDYLRKFYFVVSFKTNSHVLHLGVMPGAVFYLFSLFPKLLFLARPGPPFVIQSDLIRWGCPGLQMVDLSEREKGVWRRERGDCANTEFPELAVFETCRSSSLVLQPIRTYHESCAWNSYRLFAATSVSVDNESGWRRPGNVALPEACRNFGRSRWSCNDSWQPAALIMRPG